jgi:hypothetical protein
MRIVALENMLIFERMTVTRVFLLEIARPAERSKECGDWCLGFAGRGGVDMWKSGR